MAGKIPEMDGIEKSLIKLQDRKDRLDALSRNVIRLAGKTITQIHTRDLKSAEKGMNELIKSVASLKTLEKGLEYYSLQAHQEYVEALALYKLVSEHRVISCSEAGSGEVPYVLGLMDLVGELKREVLDALRGGRSRLCERVLRHHALHIRFHKVDALRERDSARPEKEAGCRAHTARERGQRPSQPRQAHGGAGRGIMPLSRPSRQGLYIFAFYYKRW